MKNYTLVFTPEAIQEIQQVVDWYNKEQKGLGKRFKALLRKEVAKLKRNPYTRSVRYDDVRFAIRDCKKNCVKS